MSTDADPVCLLHAQIQGVDGLWFAGAWLGYGFHEDGLRTGLQVRRIVIDVYVHMYIIYLTLCICA